MVADVMQIGISDDDEDDDNMINDGSENLERIDDVLAAEPLVANAGSGPQTPLRYRSHKQFRKYKKTIITDSDYDLLIKKDEVCQCSNIFFISLFFV